MIPLATHSLFQQPEVSRRVLLVDSVKEPRLSLTPSLRASGHEVVSVDSLLAARVELGRFRPMLVLVDWRTLSPEGLGCSMLRAHPTHGNVPILVVVGRETPAELLEVCVRSGAEDCVLGPVRLHELQARLDVLRDKMSTPTSRTLVRRTPRTVLLVGEAPGTHEGLGGHLEACGHHLLYAPTEERALALASASEEPVHLLLVRTPVSSAEALARVTRLGSDPRLGQVPTVVVTDDELPEAQSPGQVWLSARTLATRHLLSRINGQLQRNLLPLLVDERVPFVCPVEFREVGAFSWSSCYSSALSPGALFVRTLVPARLGAALELRIHLPTTREVLEGSGLVAWANPYEPRRTASYPLGMGIQFLGVSPRRLMLLRELIRSSTLC
jgi:uncharacterized protein (TIGR02266 family)